MHVGRQKITGPKCDFMKYWQQTKEKIKIFEGLIIEDNGFFDAIKNPVTLII